MPFSRYQIRNEFSLADPELYKAADKDDPEALLEGVAMAGLVGVLRQLGDLAEFAAEIFHGLHEEVMVTATRGHGLLVRVQQLESDFPSIERAFLSQTGHSAFFSSSGIGWHPNLQTDQNLITKGDLPRFVMDSYEECRGPPRLFLLDKFDVAGAGACLKRYTDPSFYKVEASSFEMRNTEAQRDKNVRKTKKKGSRWKNGETPDVFQPSHVKLHQLLMEERMQNRADETARHVKLKKREIKFPFDTETGKGYMETLLSSPPEDKLVHEVPEGNTVILPMQNESPFQSPEGNTVNSPMQDETPFQSPIVDKSVNMEHIDNTPENLPGELPESVPEIFSEIEEEVEEKHISIDNHKGDEIISDGSESDDVGENYVDALGTMESEIETETETKANSDSVIEHLQSQSSDSQSDNESGSNTKKVESFSYSDTSTTSTDNTPRSATFASTEIPFRPRVLSNQVSDVGANWEESGLKESGSSEMSSSNCVEENKIDSEVIAASKVNDLSLSHRESEDGISNSTLEISNVEEETLGPSLEEVGICDADVENHSEEISHGSDTCSLVKGQSTDDVLETKSDVVSYSSENETETELNDKESLLFETESKAANVVDDDEGNTEDNLSVLVEENESMEREPESAIPVPDDIDTNASKILSTCEDIDLEKKKVEFIEMDEDDGVSTTENGVQDSDESVGKKESGVESLTPPESDSIPSAKELTESDEKESEALSAAYDHSNIQFLDTIHTNENEVDNTSANLDEKVFVIEKTDENGDIQPDLDFQTVNNDSMSTEAETSLHLDNIATSVSNQEVESKSMNNQEFEDSIESTPSLVATNKSTLHISELYITDLPQVNSQINHLNEAEDPLPPVFTGMNMLPQLTPPINLEEMPPLPPLPPMQWRMGKPQNTSFFPTPNDPQNITNNHFPPPFPQIMSQPSQDPNENPEFQKTQHDHEVLQTESSSHIQESENEVENTEEEIVPQPPQILHIQESENEVKNTEEEIVPQPPQIVPQPPQLVPQPPQIVPQLPINVAPFQIVSTSGEDERPNGIRPMKVQRPRTPLIDAVAAHDKSKLRKVTERVRPQVPEEEERENLLQLRKVSERSRPQIPKEEERDTLLEQIRAKSFNLKPAVQTRPSIQGPSTNLRVAAILEKANAIRHAFAGSDDDEEDDDSWSDS